MNPFDLRWLWRAVRGHSLTLALVFLLTVIGLSTPDLIRRGLAPLDLSWWMLWLAPLIVIWLMMRLEPVFVPSEKLRRWLALGVVLVALAVVFVFPRLFPEKTGASAERVDHVGTPVARPAV